MLAGQPSAERHFSGRRFRLQVEPLEKQIRRLVDTTDRVHGRYCERVCTTQRLQAVYFGFEHFDVGSLIQFHEQRTAVTRHAVSPTDTATANRNSLSRLCRYSRIVLEFVGGFGQIQELVTKLYARAPTAR